MVNDLIKNYCTYSDVTIDEFYDYVRINGHFSAEDFGRIKEATEFSDRCHEGQLRKRGEKYICHPLRSAMLIVAIGINIADIVIEVLVHDVVEDCTVTLSDIENMFGSDVKFVVDGVTAVEGDYSKDKKDIFTDKKIVEYAFENNAVAMVKWADRCDNLLTCEMMPDYKMINKCVNTRTIIELLRSLSLYDLASTLENVNFKVFHNDENEKITKLFENYQNDAENNIKSTVQSFKEIFENNNEVVAVTVAQRSNVSLYRALISRIQNIDDFDKILFDASMPLYDVFVRFDDSACEMLTAETLFRISFTSQLNSLGIVVGKTCFSTNGDETYIVVKDDKNYVYRVFAKCESEGRSRLLGDSTTSGSLRCYDDYAGCFKRRIKVYLRDGLEYYVPEESTVLDLAFLIHTDLGMHFSCAIVNGHPSEVKASYRLINGDRVIIRSSPEVKPDIRWFRYCHTAKAREKLVLYFRDKITE